MTKREPHHSQKEIQWPDDTEPVSSPNKDAAQSESESSRDVADSRDNTQVVAVTQMDAALPPAPDQPERDRILYELDQAMLVEAAAGTGKTTCLIGRMVNLIREGKSTVSTLAAVTFTRKAAAELRTRFQLALEQAVNAATNDLQTDRLQAAVDEIQQCFIGTIHSFCGRLLRERPFEAGVAPDFAELDEQQDAELRRQVWRDYVSTLVANNDPILPELEELGLRVTTDTRRVNEVANELDEIGLEAAELGPAFLDFAEFPDVHSWPATKVSLPDFSSERAQVEEYRQHMESFDFPDDRGTDELMNRYETILRKAKLVDFENAAEFMQLLELFKDTKVTQKCWPNKTGKTEKGRWEKFVAEVANPARQAWAEYRYEPCMRAIQPARELYRNARSRANALNFHDLLQMSAGLLRDQPEIRTYFRSRFTHLLIDEFQDTDPIQAEVMMLLTADDSSEQDWQKCRPVPGSLFVVGDPKQSIYRFRRADIQTYNKVRKIIEGSSGVIVSLTANFRSTEPVVRFVNSVFGKAFPNQADDFSPANRELQASRSDSMADSSIQRLIVPTNRGRPNTRDEAWFIARTIRAAIDGADGWEIPRTPQEQKAGLTSRPVPADFLIIPRRKKKLSLYANALQWFGIPQSVTGGKSLNSVPELRLLHLVIRAITRSDDPVALVAVLRSELFGVADTSLYAFKQAGGHFAWSAPVPEQLDATDADQIANAFQRLQRYADRLSADPAGSAIEQIAGDLGLFARAAAANDGGMRAGSLMKAIELVRDSRGALTSSDFMTSLEALANSSEVHSGTTARSPAEAPVRIMNLHQCKGLEAPVVFLVDPTREDKYPVGIHIDRAGDQTHGFLPVYGSRVHDRSQRRHLLAQPQNWDRFAQREEQFLTVEEDRLRYVAATRAGVRLIVSQRDGKNEGSFWEDFDADLEEMPVLADPGNVAAPHSTPQAIDRTQHEEWLTEIDSRWGNCLQPTYDVQAIKQLAVTGTKPAYGDETRGKEWGTVLHTLLEAAIRHPDAALSPLAISALTEQGLSLNLLDDVLSTVSSVTASDMWQRAQSAEQCLVEIPISVLSTEGKLPTVLRGVIDLVFREAAGWVIVDYKSERVDAEHLPQLTEYYRPQLEAYGDHWHKVTGESVAERAIFYIHTGEYVRL